MTDKEVAKKSIETLVLKFKQNEDSYTSGAYNETQVRREFIDPFFEALGWDISNEQGLAEQYKDVIHEDAVKVGEQTKAPDYSFRVGGVRKFFVEAKKPSVSIKEDLAPAYQVRRYAWSAKLPLSILTDFQELAIYDCRLKPNHKDKASAGRVAFYTYDQYIEKFDEIYGLFSKEAVLKGGFDKFAQTDAKKKGTTEVDKEFLKDIEHWRVLLATNIALRNAKLSHDELNYAVQTIIDRIIFLRICEDRGLENADSLKNAVAGANAYKKIAHLFELADAKYNSGLFDFSKDTITLSLHIDNEVFEQITQSLYYPAPYVFSQMPVEILGQVYEQFLGKVIRLTAGHHAKVEEKPEVRKAGGVYYTPQYIVDYIVKNTVGALLNPFPGGEGAGVRSETPRWKGMDIVRTRHAVSQQGLSPKEIEPIKILDPACGSGSFLIGAYTYLLNYHLDWYIANGPEKYNKAVFKDQHGDWRLTTKEAKKILLNNIYGVDIDSQAVEVTKLSLLLKVLENENREAIEQQLKMFKERALPNIDGNIKCGNSLIGPDFYEGELDLSPALSAAEREAERKKINPFDWNKEFPEIMKRGGFDSVIGNPPYVFGRDWKALGISDVVKKYFINVYRSSSYQLDMFSLFIEKALILSRNSGYSSYIVPNVWLNNSYSSKLRSFVLNNASKLVITVTPKKVFEGITVDTVIYIVRKGEEPGKSFVIDELSETVRELAEYATNDFISGDRPIHTALDNASSNIIEKIRSKHNDLSHFAAITRGVHPYRVGGYGHSAFTKGPQIERDVVERPYNSIVMKKGYRPFVYGKNLKRFKPVETSDFINYGKWLAEPRDEKFFHGKRIYSRKILGDRLVVTIEVKDTIADQQVYITLPNEEKLVNYLAAILGSKCISYYIKKYYNETDDDFPQIKVNQLKAIPIPVNEKNIEEKISIKVDELVMLNAKHLSAKTPYEKEALQRQIYATDQQIDRLVYALYGLTEEEIKVVEGE